MTSIVEAAGTGAGRRLGTATRIGVALCIAGHLAGCQAAYDRSQPGAETTIDLNGRAYRVMTDYDRSVGGYMNWVRLADGTLAETEADRTDAVTIVTQKIGPFLCAGQPFEVKPEPGRQSLRPSSTFYQPDSARWVVIAECPRL